MRACTQPRIGHTHDHSSLRESPVELLGHSLYYTSLAVWVIALVWSFVAIFRENKFLAGLCLFLPMGLPVALILKWPRTWRPLATWLLALTLFFSGLSLLRPGG